MSCLVHLLVSDGESRYDVCVSKFQHQALSARPRRLSQLDWIALVVILVAALSLRLWNLPTVPPGMTHDEAGHGQDARAILRGARPIYQTIGYGREPLYDYLTAVLMGLTGRLDYQVLRWISVIFGLLAIAGTYLWVRRAIGSWEAILSSGWLALSFWALTTSRQGLRSSLLPGLLVGAVYAWWRGTFDDKDLWTWPWYGLSGLLIGATLWTYMAARVTWALFLILPLYLIVVDPARVRNRWIGMVLTLIVMAVVAAPLFVWLRRHPGAEQRFSQLGEPLRLLTTGDMSKTVANSLEALAMFTFRGDDLWVYNVSGRPLLDPVIGALFYAGLVLALLRWRRPVYALSLMWLGAGIVPSLVTGVSASTTRAIAALPVLYVFPAVALTTLFQRLRYRWRWLRQVAVPVSAVLLLLLGIRTLNDYFRVWAKAPEVRTAYHTILFEIAQALDEWQLPTGSTVALSSIYPGRYHDPYALELLLSRQDLSLRWFDGRAALVFPPGKSCLIVPAIARIHPVFEDSMQSHAELLVDEILYPADINPGFTVYEWDGAAALAEMLPLSQQGVVGWSAASSLPVEDPLAAYKLFELPATLGGRVALAGYTLSTSVVEAGGSVIVVTYWHVLSVPDPELETVIFTHLLNVDELPPVVAQQDRLDAPSWNWSVGEIFAQVHRLEIRSDVPSGIYPIEVGIYTRYPPSPLVPDPPAKRLPLLIDGQAVDDRILLLPLEVGEGSGP